MRVRSHDQGFVAADPHDVYRTLADIGRYPVWWPVVDVRPGPHPKLRLDGGPAADVSREREREGVGLFLVLGPPYDGTLEWYLEPFDDGTIVSSFLDVELADGERRARRRLLRLRSAIRRGLVGLKRTLE